MKGLYKLIENGNYEMICCQSQSEFFDIISDELLKKNLVEPTFREAIEKREIQFPTGLVTSSYNVALNHVDSIHVKTNALFIYKLEKQIEYHQMDDPDSLLPVDMVFVLLIKDHDLQVKAISEVCTIWSNEKIMMELREKKEKDEVLALLKNI
ncbi:MAG: PTS sugar transporter subunit IIA [Erysipelotrichaceae bacterium]|nr:PTS sugar transporter subunit IIA [Erysipelotrichaceae bacterium]